MTYDNNTNNNTAYGGNNTTAYGGNNTTAYGGNTSNTGDNTMETLINAPAAPELPTLSSSAMLFTNTIRCWTGNVRDKGAEAKLEMDAHAKTGTYRTYKALLKDNPELVTISKLAANIRNRCYALTVPFSHSGLMLVSTKGYFELQNFITASETEYWQAVDTFIASYQGALAQARIDGGAAFNPTDYPDVDSLRKKFQFSYAFMPVPEVGVFAELGAEAQGAVNDLCDQYRTFYEQAIAQSNKNLTDRLRKFLEVMSNQLDYAETVTIVRDKNGRRVEKREGGKRLYDSMVTNVLEVVAMLRDYNFSNSTQINAICENIENSLTGVTKEALKDNEGLRKAVKADVDTILGALPTLDDY